MNWFTEVKKVISSEFSFENELEIPIYWTIHELIQRLLSSYSENLKTMGLNHMLLLYGAWVEGKNSSDLGDIWEKNNTQVDKYSQEFIGNQEKWVSRLNYSQGSEILNCDNNLEFSKSHEICVAVVFLQL